MKNDRANKAPELLSGKIITPPVIFHRLLSAFRSAFLITLPPKFFGHKLFFFRVTTAGSNRNKIASFNAIAVFRERVGNSSRFKKNKAKVI